jgi:hypothetical protein
MSDLPADTLTTTIANALARPEVVKAAAEAMVHLRWPDTEPIQQGDLDVATAGLTAAIEPLAAAVVSVLATHNEHTITSLRALADDWEATAVENRPHLGCLDMCRHLAGELRTRLAAVSPTPPTHKEPS